MSSISANHSTYALGSSHAEEHGRIWVTPAIVEMVWERL
jgi:hypothetical protein